jgi:hypothetical protein
MFTLWREKHLNQVGIPVRTPRNNYQDEPIKGTAWSKVWTEKKSFQRARKCLLEIDCWDSKRKGCTWGETRKLRTQERWA